MESTSSDVDHTGEMAGRPSTTPPRSSRAANDTGPRSPPNADRQPSAWDPEIWKEMRGAFPVNRDLRELPPSHFREAPPSPASTSSTANTGTIAIHDGQCSSQQTPSVEVTGAGVLRPNKRRRTTPSVDGEAEPTTDDEYSVDMVSLQIQDTPSQQPANMPPSSPTKAMEYWLNEARRLRNKSPLRTQAPGWPEMVRTKPSGKNQSPEPGTTRRSSPKPLEKNTSEPIATHLPSPKPTAKRLPEAATMYFPSPKPSESPAAPAAASLPASPKTSPPPPPPSGTPPPRTPTPPPPPTVSSSILQTRPPPLYESSDTTGYASSRMSESENDGGDEAHAEHYMAALLHPAPKVGESTTHREGHVADQRSPSESEEALHRTECERGVADPDRWEDNVGRTPPRGPRRVRFALDNEPRSSQRPAHSYSYPANENRSRWDDRERGRSRFDARDRDTDRRDGNTGERRRQPARGDAAYGRR